MVTIRIMSGMNRPPRGRGDQWIFIDEDTPSDAPLLASDLMRGTLSLTQSSRRRVTGSCQASAPNLVYTPDADFNGWDYFTFTASDGTFDSNEASVNFWIWEVNDPPVAHDLQVEVVDDQPVSAPLPVTDAENDWPLLRDRIGPDERNCKLSTPIQAHSPTRRRLARQPTTISRIPPTTGRSRATSPRWKSTLS